MFETLMKTWSVCSSGSAEAGTILKRRSRRSPAAIHRRCPLPVFDNLVVMYAFTCHFRRKTES
jgi:hypothetical protein